jgi:hypothetical protein
MSSILIRNHAAALETEISVSATVAVAPVLRTAEKSRAAF